MVPEKVLSRIKKYAQNHAIEPEWLSQPPYDGVAEFWFDDLESLRVWTDYYFSKDAKELRDDEKMFAERGAAITLITDEKVII